MFNGYIKTERVPKIWLKSKVIALLKQSKAGNNASDFRPVALLGHMFKLFERIILNKVALSVDDKLIKEQARKVFDRGKSTSQVLNLMNHIEIEYERKLITGDTYINLSAAYDTINHRLLRKKTYELTNDYKFTRIIGTLQPLFNGF